MRILSLSMLLFLLASSAQAANFVVTSTADSGAGSLRQAILDSNSPAGGAHNIAFSATFPVNGVILLNSNLPQILAQSLIIDGGARNPHIDGQSLRSLLAASGGTSQLLINDLVLQNALAPESGACVSSGNTASTGLLRAQRVTFINCRASGDSLISGGAIYWNRGSGTLSAVDSEFFNNSVEATATNGQSTGGAIATNAALSVSRSVFENNSSTATTGGGTGGAIALRGTMLSNSITESTFRFNGASPGSAILGYGGAIYAGCNNCSTQIVRSYLRGNSANYGGAIYALKPSSGSPDVFFTMVNSTFYNSSVLESGGSVFIGNATSLSASNNTFYNADATVGAHLGFASSAVVNTFRANLLAPTFAGSACSGSPSTTGVSLIGFNLFSDTSCASLTAASLPNSPLGSVFVDERPGEIGVLRFSGSAVIDSISNPAICEPLDARGQSRPIDGDGNGTAECDVGAFEDPRDIIFIDGFEDATP